MILVVIIGLEFLIEEGDMTYLGRWSGHSEFTKNDQLIIFPEFEYTESRAKTITSEQILHISAKVCIRSARGRDIDNPLI